MYARGDSIYRHKSQDNDASGKSGTVRSADDQHAYDNVCRTGVLYSNSSTSSSIDEQYYEIYDGRGPVYSNSEADAVGNLSAGLDSLQAGAPQQFSRVKSQSSSHLEVPPGGQGTKTRTGGLQDVEAFISSADAKLNKLTEMASRSPDVVSHAVSDSQKTAKASRKRWMRPLSSSSGPGPDAAAQIADELNKTRHLSQSSDSEPMVTVQMIDELKTTQRRMAARISRLESQQPPPAEHAQSPDEEPIYASLAPCRKTATTVSFSSASSSSITSSSSDTLNAVSASHDASALNAPSFPTSSGAGLRQLPSICAEFATESECEWQLCPHLHVCAAWLVGLQRCPVFRRCPWPHSLRTAHNMTVLHDSGWRQDEHDKVRRWLSYQDGCDRLEADRLPPVCLNHARGVCWAQPCDALHMCARFLTGFCQKQDCPLGHDLFGDENNRRVLMMSGNEDVPAKKLLNKIKACILAGPRFF